MRISRRAFVSGSAAAVIAGAAPRAAWAQTEADVVIIGAGLAGLHAAGMLEDAGQRVVVLEGSERIGGRLHTLDDLPHRPEAGGVQVGSGYARLIAHAERLGIPLVGGGEEPRDALYHIKGVSSTGADWPTSAGNRLEGAERAVPPAALGSLYARRLPALASPEAWRSFERIAALDESYAQALRRLGASEEAIRLINANLNGSSVETMSALHIARTAAIFRSQPGPVRTIGGGSQRLPEAMAASLRSPVRLNERVTSIAEEVDGVTLRTESSTIRARHVICTAPLSVMRPTAPRAIRFAAPLAPAIERARAAIPYTSAIFLYLAARTPFWREDGYPPTLWSDDWRIGRVFVLSDDPPILKVWIAGPNVGDAYRLGLGTNGAAVIAAIERARPAARGQLSLLRRFDWGLQPFAGGIYHHIGAQQGETLAAATAHVGTRLHFAGEHLAIAASGMEGALESGERAAMTVLARS
jgi:monoamine oxidase